MGADFAMGVAGVWPDGVRVGGIQRAVWGSGI